MNRRSALATTASLVGLPGCLEDGPARRSENESDDRDDERSADDSNAENPTAITLDEDDAAPPLSVFEHEFEIEDAEDATPAAIVRVGETDDSHWVVAMADADEPLEASVVPHPEADADPLYERTADLSVVVRGDQRMRFRRQHGRPRAGRPPFPTD